MLKAAAMSQLRTSLLAALSAAFLAAACGGSTPAPVSPGAVTSEAVTSEAAPDEESAPSETLVAPGEAKIGDKTTCLVSKHTFTVSADSPTVEHEGKTYFFCCPGCDEKFMQDPAKYLGSAS